MSSKLAFSGILLLGLGVGIYLSLFAPNQEGEFVLDSDQEAYREALVELLNPVDSISDVGSITGLIDQQRWILLGESSHGTSEFYRVRSDISKELIQAGEISFVAVEGDWAQLHWVNRYVKGMDDAPETAESALTQKIRWPEWLWANQEFAEFVTWLRQYNQELAYEDRIGIYGLDFQDLPNALVLMESLVSAQPSDLAQDLDRSLLCFNQVKEGQLQYLEMLMQDESCQSEAEALVADLRLFYSEAELYTNTDLFLLKQTAVLIKHAERRDQSSLEGGADGWNLRVEFMKESAERLASHYAAKQDKSIDQARAIIWAHNTHIGDARATDMATVDMINKGQLLRQDYGNEQVFALGMGTYSGSVIAGFQWGSPSQEMIMPAAVPGSLEWILASLDYETLLLDLGQANSEILNLPINHRAVGVVYNPEQEAQGNYVPTQLPSRYDAFLFIRQTEAVDRI